MYVPRSLATSHDLFEQSTLCVQVAKYLPLFLTRDTVSVQETYHAQTLEVLYG